MQDPMQDTEQDTESRLLERISRNPEVMAGQPVIRGTRITVGLILESLAYGMTVEEILDEYWHITREDMLAGLCYAEKELERNIFLPAQGGA